MRSKIIVMAGALVLMTTPIFAQQSNNALAGVGATTCSEFADLLKRDPVVDTDYFDWAQGFMTGINWQLNANVNTRHLQHNLGDMDEDYQRLHIRRYCGSHPSEPYLAAVYDL